jgi:hypothetical protein
MQLIVFPWSSRYEGMVRLSQKGSPSAETFPPTPTWRITEMISSWCSPASFEPDCSREHHSATRHHSKTVDQ